MEFSVNLQASFAPPELVVPTRGIVPLQNRKGVPWRLLDVLRWLHLSHEAFKTDKIDLLVDRSTILSLDTLFAAVAQTPSAEKLHLSLRTPVSLPVPPPAHWPALWDVMVTAGPGDARLLLAWLDGIHERGLRARVQWNVPEGQAPDGSDEAKRAVAHPAVAAVTLAVGDPFESVLPASGDQTRYQRWIEAMADSVRALDVPLSIVGAPFCMVGSEYRPHIRNSRQFYMDPQHYSRAAYDFGLRLFDKRPGTVGKIIQLRLKQGVTYDAPWERRLLELLFTRHPVAYGRILVLRTFLRWTSSTRLLPYDDALDRTEGRGDAFTLSGGDEAECRRCSLASICDRRTVRLEHAFPVVPLKAIPGADVHDPMQFARESNRYYDRLDREKASWPAHLEHLASDAALRVANKAPTRVLDSAVYQAENTYSKPLPGAVRWFSIRAGEKISRIFHEAVAPYTVAVTFGGGMADLIGFSLSNHVRVLCPMIAPSHRLVLHVDREGAFVLLRDGVAVRPADVPGHCHAPMRLPTRAQMRLSMWRMDGSLFTQNLAIWCADKEPAPRDVDREFSVIIVSSRFSRRLQATLRCLAHQEIPRSSFEVIVAYVPGVDGTDDTLSSTERTYPELNMVRSPLPERFVKAKGVAINQAIDIARGRWHLLLDADTLLPSDFLSRVRALGDAPSFVGPDRRKMLPADVTAAILMGEVNPWESWESLLDGPGELRVREGGHLPVGYCQCVRATCTERVRYKELDHFEGADWDFITEIEQTCGPGELLEGLAVLHLDHGGSQWYGASQHF